MKPNEFDNLIRSKFDENDFEYNPGNWEQLVARMDDKPGKRRTFLWVPMAIIASTASIAASLAMIITIPALMHHKAGAPIASVRHYDVPAKSNTIADLQPTFVPVVPAIANDINNLAKTFNSNTNNRKDNSLSLRAVFDANTQAARSANALLAFNATIDDEQIKIEDHPKYPVYNTFNTESDKKTTSKAKTTISIAGGLNYGNAISGYSIGATGKRMLGDHLYIESDLAFVNDNTTERSEYWVVNNIDSRAIGGRMVGNDFSAPAAAVPNNLPSVAVPLSNPINNNNLPGSVGSASTPVRVSAAKMVLPVTGNIPSSVSASVTPAASFSNSPFTRPAMAINGNNSTVRRYAGAKMASSGSSSDNVVESTPKPAAATVQEREVNYNLYYAQVTPTLGYNIHKKISVGVGADVQRLLLNETTTSGTDAGQSSTREVPAFDLGLVGKAECALTNTIKAGVSYRQGMNNVVAPNANYLDRNYVQVQLKFLLLRK